MSLETPHTSVYRRILVWAATLLGLLGLVLGITGLTALAGAFLAMLVQAWWRAKARSGAIDVRREAHWSAFEDDQVTITLVLENRGRRSAHLVEVTDSFGAGMADRQVVLEPGPFPGRRRRRLAYRTFCSRGHGVYGVGPMSIVVADALGLFKRRKLVPRIDTFAVFPRVYAMPGLSRLGSRPSLTPQAVAASRAGAGAVYLGVRDYRPGDELRRIHWPATARRQRPVVKEYESDLVPYLTLFPDLDRSTRAGTGRKSTREYVVRLGASLLWSAIRRGDTVQILGEGQRPLLVPPGRGELHLTHGLYELIRLRLDGTLSVLDVVERHRAHLPHGSTAAILAGSIRIDETRLVELIATLRAAHVHPLVIIVNSDSFAPFDRAPLPEPRMVERCERLRTLLRGHATPGLVLGIGDELADALTRPDLLEASA
jgi:uncharacterized protein (DUF58 family)